MQRVIITIAFYSAHGHINEFSTLHADDIHAAMQVMAICLIMIPDFPLNILLKTSS